MLMVAVWHARRSAKWQNDKTASRLADAIAQDTERDAEQLDLILQTDIGKPEPDSQRTKFSPVPTNTTVIATSTIERIG
jgi:hypothetical protein